MSSVGPLASKVLIVQWSRMSVTVPAGKCESDGRVTVKPVAAQEAINLGSRYNGPVI
jgi:hypothetical protein